MLSSAQEGDAALKPENLEKINRSFEVQAPNFESREVNFSKEEYLSYAVSAAAPGPGDTVLEAAAGTCACGRAFAPLVRTVVCLDATEAMLEVGRREAERAQLGNMVFVKGYVEELPFLSGSFDMVFSRLAFHHFTDVQAAFAEMARVLKPGGLLVMIDMEAAPEPLRESEDAIETLRDPSHVKNLSLGEMRALFAGHGLSIEKCEVTRMTQHLGSWLALTKTPDTVSEEIVRRMRSELGGGDETGFSPYISGGGICFDQRWVLMTGRKE